MKLIFGSKQLGIVPATVRFATRPRLLLISFVAIAALLVPAAQAAAANFPLAITTEGNGSGTVECKVNGGSAEACAVEYAEGTEIAFVAKPATGSEFVEWGGDCIGQPECELTIEEPTTVNAVFGLKEFKLEISTEGVGQGEVECSVNQQAATACEAEYPFGTKVALLPVAEPGSKFVEWDGACSGSGFCKLTITEETSVSAVFEPAFVLEVEEAGTGSGTVTSSPAGINCGSTCSAEFVEGETVTLTASPGHGSEFAGWEGCDAEPTADECEVTIAEERVVVATFEPLPEFTLEVEVEGSGTVSAPEDIHCPSVCAGAYSEGETVTLTAEPSLGSEFVEWEGCDETSGVECEVTMNEDRTVGAIFKPEPPPSEFALSVSLAGTGSGTVTSSPAGINCGVDCSEAYAAGTEVTLTATAASGSTFSGWSGACTGAGACKVTMSQARSVTATFTKQSVPPPPSPGTAIVASTAKVKSGKAQLKLTCKGEGPCKGSLKLTAKIKSGGKTKNKTIGTGSFSLAAGATVTLKVKLSGPAKQAIAKKPLKAKVSGSGVSSSTVKLKK